VTPAELEELITKARDEKWSILKLDRKNLSFLPDSIGQLTHLRELILYKN
jgi:hypothetical protein